MKNQEIPKSSPFKHAEADDSPGFLLWKLIALWQGKLAKIFAQFSITQTQYAILASLLWFEQQHKQVTQARLVEHTKIDKMTLSKSIKKLVQIKLIQREPSDSDSRAILVRLTAKGRKLIQQAIVAVEHTDDEFFSELTAHQLITWKRLTISLINSNQS